MSFYLKGQQVVKMWVFSWLLGNVANDWILEENPSSWTWIESKNKQEAG